ncbi:branched-chain amino acid ABC transporter permease [Modestobacter versicolor]|uniref:Branched-chain amino acid ABC transporter permease n=1 Tax=Modestobacter versicolor TaxID=429133 RepID=A0A323VAG4_9ACTN|nr:branched-chain amino acid ABC transporter permease [Modestobacter versicolor]MBB3675742.1 branched-chain amino acid transport system permease protein [Modestobacter versicolor]PZA21140.1 branched-chain amino acid ABC transporter permease [Modestobacter versicolor]
MSEATATRPPRGATRAGGPPASRPRRSLLRPLLLVAVLLVLLLVPFYVEEFWLRTGFAVFGAVVGAIGLNLLVGTTGQLSLAHAFFLAVGAISYVFVSGDSGGIGVAQLSGLGLPPIVGMVVGVLLAGLAGLLFSPIAARLRGIYLGVASLSLVFIGQHVLNSWTSVTGGFNGRSAPDFSLFGFTFANRDPLLFIANVEFREAERLWYLGLALAVAAYVFARNLLRSRPGRALQTLRDSEVAASVMGVNVQRYKGRVFLVSSMYAGLSGVMYALSIGSVAPESFGLEVSIQYLAMIVLGGLGSVGGAALGAVFVSALPLVFQRYADAVPFVSGVGEGGLAAGEAARFLYGGAIVLVILFQPAGLAGLGQRFRRSGRDPGGGRAASRSAASTSTSTTDVPSDPPAQGSTS